VLEPAQACSQAHRFPHHRSDSARVDSRPDLNLIANVFNDLRRRHWVSFEPLNHLTLNFRVFFSPNSELLRLACAFPNRTVPAQDIGSRSRIGHFSHPPFESKMDLSGKTRRTSRLKGPHTNAQRMRLQIRGTENGDAEVEVVSPRELVDRMAHANRPPLARGVRKARSVAVPSWAKIAA